MSEPIHMGSPHWDIGRFSIAGTAEEHAARLREFGAVGLSHVQVKFRSRSATELLDQMHTFAADVMPLLPQ